MSEREPIQDHALETMTDEQSRLVEDRLWWVQGRKAIIKKFMERAAGVISKPNIMDIGCGSGGNLDVLRQFGNVSGVEPSPVLARRARERGVAVQIFEQDVLQLDECRGMQLFTMFDVLEHISDDRRFLTGLKAKSGQPHHLLISVPACQFLYSDHDRILHHYRRYSTATLHATLEAGGYEVLYSSYFMFFLFPLVLFARFKEKIIARFGKRTTNLEIGDFPNFISIPFAATLRSEAALSGKVRFPIGLWLFALAKAKNN